MWDCVSKVQVCQVYCNYKQLLNHNGGTWRRFIPSLLLSALQGSHSSSVSSKTHSTDPFFGYLYISMWKGEDLEKNTLCVLNASTEMQQMPLLLIFHWPKQVLCLHSTVRISSNSKGARSIGLCRRRELEILASGGNLYQGSHTVTKAVAPESYMCPALKQKPITLIELQGEKKTAKARVLWQEGAWLFEKSKRSAEVQEA